MKKYLSLLVLIVVVILALPAAMGQYTKYKLTAQLNQEVWPGGYRTTVQSYQAGWLSSNITVFITKGLYQPDRAQQLRVPVTFKLYHGPVAYVPNLERTSTVYFAFGIARGVIEFGQIPLDFLAKLNFDGLVSVDIESPKLQTKVATVFNFSFDTLNAHLILDHQHLKGDAAVNNLQFSNEAGKLAISAIQVQMDMKKVAPSLWLGERTVKIPSLIFSMHNKPELSLDQLSFNDAAHVNNQLIDSTVQVKTERVAYHQNESIGPITFNSTGKNLQLNKLSQLADDIANTRWDNAQPNFSSAQASKIVQDVIAMFPGMEFQFMFSAATVKGLIKLDGAVNFSPQMQSLPATSFDAMLAPLIAGTKAIVKIEMPVEFYNQVINQLGNQRASTEDMVTALQSVGAIKLVNTQLQSELRYENSQVTINGIPLQQLIAQLKPPAAAAAAPEAPAATVAEPHSAAELNSAAEKPAAAEALAPQNHPETSPPESAVPAATENEPAEAKAPAAPENSKPEAATPATAAPTASPNDSAAAKTPAEPANAKAEAAVPAKPENHAAQAVMPVKPQHQLAEAAIPAKPQNKPAEAHIPAKPENSLAHAATTKAENQLSSAAANVAVAKANPAISATETAKAPTVSMPGSTPTASAEGQVIPPGNNIHTNPHQPKTAMNTLLHFTQKEPATYYA